MTRRTAAAEFVDRFAKCEPISCVSPCLFVNVQSGACGNSTSPNGGYRTTLANPKRVYSFISGYDALQVYSGMQNLPGSCNNFDKVTKALLQWVGFPDSTISSSCSYRLAVFEGKISGGAPGSCDIYDDKQGNIWAPLWVTFGLQLRDAFDVHLPAPVLKELTLNNLDWTASTGCTTRENIYCGSKDPGMDSCGAKYKDALATICPAYSANGTRGCAAAFKEKYGGDGSTAPVEAARALLAECFGSNSYFSGWGYGWNPKLGWTSAEFLVDNMSPQDLGSSFVDLSFGRSNRFQCFDSVLTPIRLSAKGNTECPSWDGTNCMWGFTFTDCLAFAAGVNPDVAVTLECGEGYGKAWGSGTGYEDPEGWCAKGKHLLLAQS